tara:strand:- start:123 stop:443 length:321 start_codon:yes stop_codon:yes gene_type:complete
MSRFKKRPLILDAELSDPPSSRTCFRDVTLYANIFAEADVLVECSPGTVDFYWKWLKRGGAMDFVEQIIRFGEEDGYSIRRGSGGNINLERLDEVSLNIAIRFLMN